MTAKMTALRFSFLLSSVDSACHNLPPLHYIAILDDSVDRCVSFDGQGFSDEFYEKYADQIAHNKNKIVNCSAESDYVNFLLLSDYHSPE